MVNYNNASVYKLCCKDPEIKEIYVGSTVDMKKRKYNHKTVCNNNNNNNNKNYNAYVYQFIRSRGGFDNWDIIQVEKCSVKDKKELEMRERYWFETLGASLNKKIPTLTQKERIEYNKEYYETNKEQFAENQKVYYKTNKEQISEKYKVYYKTNKEHISEKNKEYYKTNKEKSKEKFDCECGSTIRRSDLARHKKTTKHLNNIK